LKLHTDLIERLQQLADQREISRAQLIEDVLSEYLDIK
jgi:predicted transcriptional regulator